jgi:hypothetical protein
MGLFRLRWTGALALAAFWASLLPAADIGSLGLAPVRERAVKPFALAENNGTTADVVLLTESELVRNAADWIVRAVQQNAGAVMPMRGPEPWQRPGRHLVAAVGDGPLLKHLRIGDQKGSRDSVGPQGFIIQTVADPQAGELLLCWSPTALGCRYGLIEILRSLRIQGRSVSTDLGRVIDRPQFPMRICYVNFAEHLQNAFNPNVLFDVSVNRWSAADWERFIDMVSAFRYNVFEFWLVPSLFAPEALQGGKMQRQFAETMNRVIAYGKRRGVSVHPILAVNTVGANWHYHCPNIPAEKAEIIALWDHWSRTLRGNDSMGIFPGDPGGCTKNGCSPETYVDLCLELSRVVRRNNLEVKIEIGTWGEPMGGWGVPLWTGKPDRAEKAMNYFLDRLPQFPPGTFTSINLGFSPDATLSHGGDGRPYARRAAKTNPVLTWDYSVTEGEGTVSPRCRVRRIFERRREERAVGCYSGGICYTMAPKLQVLSLFCCAEAWWDPSRSPDAVLADFGRLVFGDSRAAIGPLLEEFEVVPDWGYYPPFPFSPRRVQVSMAKLAALLKTVDGDKACRLPLAPTPSEYRRTLLDFAELFQKLAEVDIALEDLTAAVKTAGKMPAEHQGLLSLAEAEQLLTDAGDFPGKDRVGTLVGRLRQLDVRGLMKRYWDTVYGIYDVIPHPVDPRAQGATAALFQRFHCPLALVYPKSALEKALEATRKPFVLVPLGQPGRVRGWKLSGWVLQGEDGNEPWQASFDQPGLLVQDNFQDRGYRWLVVRLTEGPAGGRKTIAVNDRVIGQFVRTGPAVSVKKEWWVTRCYPIPPGLLRKGKLEIRFTDPGVAIAAVALSAERIAETDP